MTRNSRKCHRDTSVATALLVLVCNTALAGSYQLVYGSGVPVREAYERNLAPHHEDVPMACERKYDPKITGFRSPPWKEVDIAKHFALFQEVEAYRETEGASPMEKTGNLADVPAWALKDESYVQAHNLKMYKAKIDMLGNGKKMNLLATVEDSCGPDQWHGMKTTRIFFLNSAGTHLDYRAEDNWGGVYINTSIELYDGKPYFEGYSSDDNWGHLLTGKGKLYISRPVVPDGSEDFISSNFEKICEISWAPDKTSNSKGEQK